jgi:hypothetical protein
MTKVYVVYRLEALCPAVLEAIHASRPGAEETLKRLQTRSKNPPVYDDYGLAEGEEFTIEEITVGI